MAGVSGLPSGTVTFVFTDVEGSTALLKQLGESYGELLAAHRRIIRRSFGARGGVEIDTQGDAFFFAFPRAREAVAASIEAQRAHATQAWPQGRAVLVRMGLHTGEPAVGEEGYLGLDVVRAARICTVGRGGRVLLSETTRALVGGGLPDGVAVHPLGERRLKDIEEPERVYELHIEGVQPASPEAVPGAEPVAQPGTGESDLDRRFEQAAARHAAEIQEQVLRSVEASLGGMAAERAAAPEADDDSVEALAERGARLGDEITRRVEEALRRSGLDT
jgi:class 3 adenylate cyclase